MAKIVQTAGRNALGTFAPEFAQYFIWPEVFLHRFLRLRLECFNVTFEPGCSKLDYVA